MIDLPSDYPDLSKRQLEVILLLAEGHRPQRISDILNIGEDAVNKHIAAIRKKMSAKTNAQAIWRFAISYQNEKRAS